MVHVTISTAHFDEELHFFQEVCQLNIMRDMRPHRNMVFLADQEGDTCVEIIEDPDAQAISCPSLSVGFHCEDPETKRLELKDAGYEVTDMISPNPHVKFFFAKAPSGIRIQFI